MNKVILMGRLTKDPEVRFSQGDNSTTIARYSLAIDRRQTRSDGSREADFLNIVAFGRAGEFAEKYLQKGIKVLVTGHIQTGSYTNRDGIKIYTTDIIAEDQEFCESKKNGEAAAEQSKTDSDGFMNLPEGIEEDLPFARNN